jgi:general secretion pathway protein E
VEKIMSTQNLPILTSFSYAKQHGIFLRRQVGDAIECVFKKPLSITAYTELQRRYNTKFVMCPVSEEKFAEELAHAFESGDGHAQAAIDDMQENMDLQDLMNTMPQTEDLLAQQDDAPVIQLINAVITQALKEGSSDIHFEVFEHHLAIRFRIDGMLKDVLSPPRVVAALLVSRLKIMAKLDIAEKRLPQDGRIQLKIAGRHVDVRVSTIPTHYGERVVLRLLDKKSAPLDMAKLGMGQRELTVMRKLICKPHGIILVTGPTGSGKTTSLYAALTELNEKTRNIMTVEDPIEYYLDGISQTQVNPKVDMTFARGLRSILRQDPDVVMVGEIRDLETAEMAVQASLTGHLVLSTLHTNSAIGAITRLRDMGVESFLLSSTLIGVVAQRLIRILCPHCRQAYVADQATCELLGVDFNNPPTIYKETGCAECNSTGYIGRSGIYECIEVNEKLQSMIHRNSSESEMISSIGDSYRNMQADGWRRVLNGQTAITEVLRITARG